MRVEVTLAVAAEIALSPQFTIDAPAPFRRVSTSRVGGLLAPLAALPLGQVTWDRYYTTVLLFALSVKVVSSLEKRPHV